MNANARDKCPGGAVLKVILIIFGLCLLWSSGAGASLYIKFDGINGPVIATHHLNWSEISRVEWGVSMASQGGPGGTGGASRANFADLSWEQLLDKSFPKLFANLSTGKYLQNAKVDFTYVAGEDVLTYFQMQFQNIYLTNLNLSGSSSSPTTFWGSFAYDRIYMKYTWFDESGNPSGFVDAGFDVKKNVGWLPQVTEVYARGMSGPAHTPVPASVLLLGSGLLGLGALGWRRKTRR